MTNTEPWFASLPGSFELNGESPGQAGVVCVLGPIDSDQFEMALRASIIVAAPSASFCGGQGSPPKDPATPSRLAQRLGAGGAARFWLDPRPVSSRRALHLGLIDRVENDPGASAEEILALWRRYPAALQALISLGESGRRLDPDSARRLERARFALAFSSEVPRKGAGAFFEDRGRTSRSGG